MSSDTDDESVPVMIHNESPYNLVKSANLGIPAANYKPGKFVEIAENEVSLVPGSRWLYERYTHKHLRYLRLGHTASYGIQIILFVIGVSIYEKSSIPLTSNTITPFTLKSEFIIAGWVFLLLLESLFIYAIHLKTLTSVELMAQELRYYYFPKYFLFGAYFFLTWRSSFVIALVNMVLVAVACPLLYFIYHRIKYQDDGRFLVSRLEFLAMHVNISLCVAWVLVQLFHKAFVFIEYYSPNYSDTESLGWDNSHWSVCAMALLFSLGVISLSSYKDVFFNLVIIYSFIGIYIEQLDCPSNNHNNCTQEVRIAVIAFISVLSVFVVLVFGLYYNQIMYRRRR